MGRKRAGVMNNRGNILYALLLLIVIIIVLVLIIVLIIGRMSCGGSGSGDGGRGISNTASPHLPQNEEYMNSHQITVNESNYFIDGDELIWEQVKECIQEWRENDTTGDMLIEIINDRSRIGAMETLEQYLDKERIPYQRVL